MTAQEVVSRLAVLVALVCATVFIHGAAMMAAVKYSTNRLSVMRDRPYFLARITSILVVVILMLAAHLSEMVFWGVAIYGLGLTSDFFAAYFYAMETYTTLGYREAILPETWRSLTGWLATTGILMFAWSTAILTNFVNRIILSTSLLP